MSTPHSATPSPENVKLDINFQQAIEQLNAIPEKEFFIEAAKLLAQTLGTRYVMITQHFSFPVSKLKTLSFWDSGQIQDNFEFMTDNTPCGSVIEGDGRFHFFADHVQSLFPKASGLVALDAASYAAAPVFDSQSQVTGHVAILDTKPLDDKHWVQSVLEAYANHVGIELERRQTQEAIDALTKGYGIPLGSDCFKQLAQIACETFDADFIFVVEQKNASPASINTLAHYTSDDFVGFEKVPFIDLPVDIANSYNSTLIPSNFGSLYPSSSFATDLNIDAFINIPLVDSHHNIVGHFILANTGPLFQVDRLETLLKAFANKAVYEIERIRNEQALEYYSGIVSTTDDFVAFIDKEYIFLAANQTYSDRFNRPISEIIGHSLEALHGASISREIEQVIDKAIKLNQTIIYEFWREYPSGKQHYIQAKYSPYYDAEKNIMGVAVVGRDLTELKKTQKALANSEQRLQTLYDDTPSMFFTVDADRTIQSANAFGAKELGYRTEELIGLPIRELYHVSDQEHLDMALNTCFAKIGSVQHWELRKQHKNGATIWVKEVGRLVQDNAGNDQLFIVSEDISERHKLSQKLSYQASHDALTNLLNRHEFERRLQQLLDTIAEDNTQHIMCYIDLDQFKVINDSCGHLAGDTLLKNISSLLALKVRKGDTLARLGGDEFGILMMHCSLNQAKKIAESIRQLIQDYKFIWDHKTYSIGSSIGLVTIDKNSDSLTSIMSMVDTACYAAKDSGRNCVIVYSETDQQVLRRQGDMSWLQRLQDALENDHFCLYQQKIISIENDSKPCLELLIRLNDHEGLIGPNAFLPTAERYHLSTKIDQWVIQHAFQWLRNIQSKIDDIQYCSINLSGNSLDDESFLDFVIYQLEQSQLPGEKICFEITETAAISNLAGAIKFIDELKKRGCFFALDDFGSGVSSFGYLKNLNVDFVKIDGCFVKDMMTDPIDRAMVKSINEIAHVMGKKTIAEYVEDKTILNCLTEMGVNYAQGYGIAKPQPLF